MKKMSVIVLTYNPQYESLLRTIKSIVYQQEIDFDIIISDDHSECTETIDRIRLYLKEIGFLNYKIIENNMNVGTVQNLYNGISEADGEYSKLLGQGDMLCDEYVLRDMYKCIKEKESSLIFGNFISFYDDNNNINIKITEEYPSDIKVYLKQNDEAIKYNLIIMCDIILGASCLYKTSVLKEYLTKYKQYVKYAEDYLIRVMAINNEKICYINRDVILYEYGNGISTSGNTAFVNKLMKDWNSVGELLIELSKNSKYNDTLIDLYHYQKDLSTKRKKSLLFYAKYPRIFAFKLKKICFKRLSPSKCNVKFVERCFM